MRAAMAWCLAGVISLAAAIGIADAQAAGGSRPAIVFARLQGAPGHENYEIWTMAADGTHQTRLTRNGVADQQPAWSPDGSMIAWTRYDDQFNVAGSDIWLMRADGSGKHRLTTLDGSVSDPTWSSDGRKLAFTADYGITVIDADGTSMHRISPAGAFDLEPAWSHGGNRIAFLNFSSRGTLRLMTMRAAGGDRTLVRRFRLPRFDSANGPAWSPDDREIAIGADANNGRQWGVYIMRRDGSGLRRLVGNYSLDPAWSPDGARLAFYACAVGNCGLYTARADGGGFRPLGADRRFSDIEPDWVRAAG